jgi:hypothetical protein
MLLLFPSLKNGELGGSFYRRELGSTLSLLSSNKDEGVKL